ncbi:MAG: response regulator [Bacteroidota bacterium]|nr:response regulator [Bacteroidota bacterium]
MALNKETILLVDDDMDYLFQLKITVENFGYNTITAGSQKEAERIIETKKPDLAILDLMMENEDSGFILSYKIKKRYPDVPIIIITAVTVETGYSFSVDLKEEHPWIKSDSFMDKGIRSDKLEREILRLLNNSK